VITGMSKRYKFPIEYELTPREIDRGTSWVTLKLKNIGNETLEGLDVELHSLDTYSLAVSGAWWHGAHYLTEIGPNKEKELVFQVNATGPADVWVLVKGRKGGKPFWWESSWTEVHLVDEKAEIERLLVLSNPYTEIGKTISVEATVKGLRPSTGLKLEFWVDLPSGKSEPQATMAIKDLPVGEEARYSAEFTTKEKGYYTIYAYLYDGWARIDYKTECIYAREQ
jgi:hypothetical protein